MEPEQSEPRPGINKDPLPISKNASPPTVKTSQMTASVITASNNDLPRGPSHPENGYAKSKSEKTDVKRVNAADNRHKV